VVCVGINGISAFYAHAFRADETARAIGWPIGSPFQFEIAITNLTFGILGMLCLWIRGTFWYAVGLAQAIFGLGAAYGHIVQMVVHKDFAPENSGIFLYSEIALSLILLGLLLAYKLFSQRAQAQQAASVPV
jgi:mannitol-specific phosphotransferase system IIBC component